MSLTEENGMVMPVTPMGGYGNNGGFGNFGGDWGWIILLLLIAGNGWGGFGGYGMGGFAADGAMLYPWMNQAEITTQGFQNAQIGNQITSVQSDLGDIQTQLCSGFAGIEQGANARQIANMQQNFASQTAITGAITDLGRQQADCCCENRLATCQTQNIIQNEGNQTRFADANNTKDIITNQTANTQAILDKLCQLELDGYKREADQLRAENSVLKNQGFISNEINQQNEVFYNRLKNCPVNAVPVAGNTPLFSCNPSFNTPNYGCGCGGTTF